MSTLHTRLNSIFVEHDDGLSSTVRNLLVDAIVNELKKDTVLSKGECGLLVKKLEYTYKKKAMAELDSGKPLTECSEGANLLLKLKQGAIE